MAGEKIILFDAKPYDREFFDKANEKYGYVIKYVKSHLSDDTALMAEGNDAVCVFVNDKVTARVTDILSGLGIKIVALRCAGYNNVDLKAVYGRMHLVRVPEYSPYAVAEHALALMMSLNRKTHRAYYRVRDNNFSITGLMGFDMKDKTAGVIGTGKIGRVLIGILKGLGMNVIAHDPHPAQEYERKLGFSYVPEDELYSRSDVISLHCPLTRETEHIINRESISKMKRGVMLINTGRGKLIDTKALIEGLKSGQVGYAGLDVYEEESEYFFEDLSGDFIDDDVLARLMTFPNVLITSHQGFFTEEALSNIADTTLDNIKGFFDGDHLKNEICYRCEITPCRKKEGKRCF
ncbi:MAG TPA: 2-hydroxyacid dehydrogenase [Candidatus Omnitrophota bacterium]|nr:2-hydroxyacid dehydrogenase [Candidatus Omnitrophota bacterium]